MLVTAGGNVGGGSNTSGHGRRHCNFKQVRRMVEVNFALLYDEMSKFVQFSFKSPSHLPGQ